MSVFSWLSRWAYILAVIAVTTVILFTVSFSLQQLHQDAISNSFILAETHARSFEEVLTQTLKITELLAVNSLNPDRDDWQHAEDLTRISDNFSTALTHTPFLRSLSMLGDDRIVASSNPNNLGHTVTTHNYLPLAIRNRELLRIGKPWFGRDIADGYPASPANPIPGDALAFIPITKALPDSNLNLLAAINPDFFIHHIIQALTVDEGKVEIIRLDGILLLSSDPRQYPGVISTAAAAIDLTAQHSTGRLIHKDPEGREFLSTFRLSSLYPLVVIVHLDRDQALRNFYRAAQTLLLAVIPTLLVLLVIAALYRRWQLQLSQQREEAERLQRVNAAQVFTHVSEGIMLVDDNGAIIDVNAAFTTITGYERAEVLGRDLGILKSERHDQPFYQNLWSELLRDDHWRGEVWSRRKDGQIYAQSLNISVVRDRRSAVRNFVALMTDITEQKQHQQQLEFTAQHDVLTHLPNRLLFADRLNTAMAQAKRSQHRLVVAYLDLDGFKAVNDNFGHAAGDQLLITVAQRIQEAIREGDTLARLGGDEFALILLNVEEDNELLLLFQRLLAVASEPAWVDQQALQVSASLGITFYPQSPDVNGEQLLSQADQAMYQAKQAGKNQFHYYCVDSKRT